MMNEACNACRERRVHTPAEWSEFHPFAGHGYTEGVGWSDPALEKLNIEVSGDISLACHNPSAILTVETANERAEERDSAVPPACSLAGAGMVNSPRWKKGNAEQIARRRMHAAARKTTEGVQEP